MRVVVVSNRLPFTVSIIEGVPQFRANSGGLTTHLWSCLEQGATGSAGPLDLMWVGWPGAELPHQQRAMVCDFAPREFKASPVFLPQDSVDGFYHGFCDKTLWTLFHYFTSLIRHEQE
jgi:trehalose 6-phosphate synthase/phosphatase